MKSITVISAKQSGYLSTTTIGSDDMDDWRTLQAILNITMLIWNLMLTWMVFDLRRER